MPPYPLKLTERALWRAAIDLMRLLYSQCSTEDEYQRWFEYHSVIFSVLGFDRYSSFEGSSGNRLPFDPERNYVPQPDFLCANADTGVLTVFELKTPFVGSLTTARSDGNRRIFKRNARAYIAQAIEYCEAIRGSLDAREVVKRVLDMPVCSAYAACLVYGLREEWNQASVRQLLDQQSVSIRLLGFDEILESLADRLSAGKPSTSMPGWTLIYEIAMPRADKAYTIMNFGGIDKDRVSLFRDGELLLVQCLDSNGRPYHIECLCDDAIHQVRFEFSHGGDILFMNLHVDDEQQELRLSNIPLVCDPDPSRLIFGGNPKGSPHQPFRVYSFCQVARTLTIEERLGLHLHYLERRNSPKYFEGNPANSVS